MKLFNSSEEKSNNLRRRKSSESGHIQNRSFIKAYIKFVNSWLELEIFTGIKNRIYESCMGCWTLKEKINSLTEKPYLFT